MGRRTAKIRKLLKEYFLFTTGERRGVIALLLLLVFLVALPSFYDVLFPHPPVQITVTELQTMDETETFSTHKKAPHFFTFDPNTATTEELEELGFSAKQARTVQNYRTKGGRFRKPADLGKIYGMDTEFFHQLEPYIAIAGRTGESSFGDSANTYKKAPKKVVELNTADSVELVALYRIGPAMAHRIIEYRSKLGGFVSLEQLKEIWGFDEDILYDLDGKISVDASKAKIFDLNTVKAEELKTHPYFKYKLSNAIVNYRMQHGSYAGMEDLKNIVLVNDSVYKRIVLYLKVH